MANYARCGVIFYNARRFPYEAQQYRSVIAAAVENYFTRALVGGENPCLEKSIIDRFLFVEDPPSGIRSAMAARHFLSSPPATKAQYFIRYNAAMTAPSKLPLSPVTPPLDAQQLGRRVFAGEFLLFSPFAAWSPLLAAVRRVVRESFAECANPTHAHLFLSHDEFLRRSEEAQRRVNAPSCKQLFADALHCLGLADDKLFWDTLGLRVSPPQGFDGGFRSATRVHRDTWGSGFQAQINWWAPLWPLAAKRTMGFYPSYWRRALPNSTDTWSFKEYLASRRQAKKGRAAAYPSTPQALAEPE